MAQIIITFRKTDFDPSQIACVQKLSYYAKTPMIYSRPMSGGAHVFCVVDVSENAQLEAVIQRLSGRPEIIYVKQDRIMQRNQVKQGVEK